MLDESEKKKIRDALLAVAEERLRLTDQTSTLIEQSIKMREALRKLEQAYDQLGALLRPESREELEQHIEELKKQGTEES